MFDLLFRFHDDVKVSETERFSIVKESSTYRLRISSVKEEDAGSYKVELSNKAGKSTCSALMLVEGKKIDLILSPTIVVLCQICISGWLCTSNYIINASTLNGRKIGITGFVHILFNN